MKNFAAVIQLAFDDDLSGENDKQVTEIFQGSRRRMVEVRLRHQAILAKHKALEPITVLCLSGSGVFLAGPNLEDEQELHAGTLLTLEAEVEHEAIARPSLHLLVTKFKSS